MNNRIAIGVVKGATTDTIEIARADGSTTVTTFPKKGPFPHDLVHFVVESELGMAAAFWGRIAAGAAPSDVGQLAHRHGHPSSRRARQPDPKIVELVQAERIVECFEAELWAASCASTDATTFQGVLAAACTESQVPAPNVNDASRSRIRTRLDAYRTEWEQLSPGDRIELTWNPD